jgi:hypothetical protein
MYVRKVFDCFSDFDNFYMQILHKLLTYSGSWKPLMASLVVAGLMGCATDMWKTPDYFSEKYESLEPEIRRVALVTYLSPPEIEIVDLGFTRGQGAAGGAMAGATSALRSLGSCSGAYCGAVFLLLLPVFTVGGAIVGVVSGVDADMLAEAEANANHMLNSAYLQTELLERVKNYGHDNTELEFVRMSFADPKAMVDTPDYSALLEDSIDAVLEVELLRISLKYSLEMEAKVRFISAHTGTILSDSQFKFHSEHHKLDEWIENGAAPLTEAIQRGLRIIADDLVDENFLLFYPPEPKEIGPQKAAKTSKKIDDSSSVSVPHYVLSPIYPVLESCFFCGEFPFSRPHSTENRLGFVEVNSVQPILRWERFPRDYDLIDTEGRDHQITDVRYDLRVFDKAEMAKERKFLVPAQLVYGVRDITKAYHKIETGLNMCGEYFWTVRARFKLDGRVRVTEWAGDYRRVWQHPLHLRHRQQHYWWTPGRPILYSPEWFYYPFKTPCDSTSKKALESENSTPAVDDF